MQVKGINQSQAKQIRDFIHIQKGLLKKKQKLTDFKEPVAMLVRRDNTIEFFEGATKGKFTFTHSDGDTRNIDIIPSKMMNFPYADKRVRLYILHEDHPLPLPEDPVVSSELIAISQEKSMHDINQFRLKEARIQGNMKFKIIIGIGIAIAIIMLGITVVPQDFWNTIFSKTTETVVVNQQQSGDVVQPVYGYLLPLMLWRAKRWWNSEN